MSHAIGRIEAYVVPRPTPRVGRSIEQILDRIGGVGSDAELADRHVDPYGCLALAHGPSAEAVHEDLEKRVALKTLHPLLAREPEARARFLREGDDVRVVDLPRTLVVPEADPLVAYVDSTRVWREHLLPPGMTWEDCLERVRDVVGAEIATAEQNRGKLESGVSKVTPDMTERAESDIDSLTAEHPLPEEFVLPGETRPSAALDLARSVVRRAERHAVSLERAGLMGDAEILRYLNRLSDLLFVLARFEEAEQGKRAKPSRA